MGKNNTNINLDEFTSEAVQGGTKAPSKIKIKKEFWEWLVSIATALMVVFFIRTFLFQIILVDGDSMYSTLHDGERLYVSVLDMRLNGIERGDIVICHYPNRGNTNFVKRAVAIPGDKVYRENSVTHVVYDVVDADGNVHSVDEMLDESFGFFISGATTNDYAPYTLGENEYFVVGDNRGNSHDSRDWNDNRSVNDVGPITEDMIVGKVSHVIWPLKSYRAVE